MKIDPATARAAAEWWADALRAPKFDNLGPTRGRNDKETRTSDMASMLATLTAGNNPASEESLQRFADALADAIVANGIRYLGCDYGPDHILKMAAIASGVPALRFPWKTNMEISEDGTVQVSRGYGAPYVVVYDPRLVR